MTTEPLSNTRKDCVVIGAGYTGLSAACSWVLDYSVWRALLAADHYAELQQDDPAQPHFGRWLVHRDDGPGVSRGSRHKLRRAKRPPHRTRSNPRARKERRDSLKIVCQAFTG